MATTDIIARLKLNAEGFTRELNQSLGGVERRFGQTGSVIGRNISEGVGGGLQEAAARVPVLGGALAGLSGAALIAAGGLGIAATVLARGVSEADGFETAVRGLNATLEATGNKTGIISSELVRFAEDLEGVIAVPAEEIIKAEQALSSFDGVAGDVFKRAIKDAADMAAVFGGDLSSNSEKLGTVLQNLASGNVEGLSKAFKFLGTETLTAIGNLAKTGDTAGAQERLLAELEKRVGGGAKANASGLSGAFFRLSDAIGDTTRAWATQSGIYSSVVSGINSIANAIANLGATSASAKSATTIQAEIAAAKAELADRADGSITRRSTGRGGGAYEEKISGREGALRTAELKAQIADGERALADMKRQQQEADRRAKKATDDAKRLAIEGTNRRASEQAAKDADKAAKDAARDAERQAEQARQVAESYAKTVTELREQVRLGDMRAAGLTVEADLEEALFRLRQQYPTLGAAQLKEAEALTRELVRQKAIEDENKDFERRAEKAKQVAEKANRELERQKEEQYRAEQDQIRDLAGFYRDAMDGGSKSIWKQFQEAGKDAIAVLAAQWTLAMLSGQKFSLPTALSSLGATTGNPLLSLLGGASNIGSLFGVGATHVGGGSSGFPAQVIGSAGALGGAGAAGGALASIGSVAGPVGAVLAANSMIGGLLGVDNIKHGKTLALISPLLTALFGSVKKGSATLKLNQFGELGAGAVSGNSKSRKDAAKNSVSSLADTLSNIAEQLGGEINSAGSVSIAVRKKSFRVDPTGRGMTKVGNGAIDFGKDQEAAIRFAISDALKDGVISGISDAAKKILASGQDLEKALDKAMLIESIPKLLKQRLDPLGAALDDLDAKWKKTIAALREGGATTEQMADAQKLYRLELAEVKENTKGASQSLKDFLDDLKFGSDSPFSLRDQEAAAQAALKPYLDQIAGGQSIDQDKYQAAAQRYLEIERELNGSTQAYFAELDKIQAATNKAIATIDNAVPIRTASDPFAEKTAANTQATAEIVSQQMAVLNEVRAVLQQIAAQGGFRQASFVGTQRGF